VNSHPVGTRYSYTTCSYRDSFSRIETYDSGLLEELRGLTLRITLPEVSAGKQQQRASCAPPHTTSHPAREYPTLGSATPHYWRIDQHGNFARNGTPAGPVWDMVTSWYDDFGVTLVVQKPSPASFSAAETTSSWLACCHEVAVNSTDICVGDFWAMPDRQIYMSPGGTFSRPYGEARYVLSTPVQTVQTTAPSKTFSQLLAG